MTLTIEITPDIEHALVETARRQGQTLEAAAAAALHKAFLNASLYTLKSDTTLALFEQWDQEDATDSPEELLKRDREWNETEDHLHSSRVNFRNTSKYSGDERA